MNGMSWKMDETLPPETVLDIKMPRMNGMEIVNTFSKYYSTTGWRLGWMLVPPDLARSAECLAKVRREASGQLARCLVVGLLVGPGTTRVEHLARDVGAALGHKETEIGISSRNVVPASRPSSAARNRARV
jgi:hypothetical protein